MAGSLSIHLPTFQRFDCHGCGFCCRDTVVNVTDEEKQRILDADWSSKITNQPLFVTYRFRGNCLTRLAQTREGQCVFLGDDGRCRLHAESGAAIKPLACRLFPFVPTPGVGGVRLDLRGDCPSIAKNMGSPLVAHRKEVQRLAGEMNVKAMRSPPDWRLGQALGDAEFKAIVSAFDRLLADASMSYRDRLRAGVHLLDLLLEIHIAKVRNERFIELMNMLVASARVSTSEGVTGSARVSRGVARLFGQWVFLHAVVDSPSDLDRSVGGRLWQSWRRYFQARRFARGTGMVPRLARDWQAAEFDALRVVDVAEDEALEPLCRSLRVKLTAHAFAGPGYYGCDVVSGLTALWLLVPTSGWLARLEAVWAGHDRLMAEDVVAGLRRAHRTFGISPVFARVSERLRLRALGRCGTVGSLQAIWGP